MKPSRNRVASGVCVLFACMCFASVSSAVEYTGKTLRDPFTDFSKPPEPPPDKPAKPVETEQAIQTLDLQGVFFGGKKPRAIINGKIVEEGVKLPVGKLEKINKDGVTVLYNNKTYELRLKERKSNEKTG